MADHYNSRYETPRPAKRDYQQYHQSPERSNYENRGPRRSVSQSRDFSSSREQHTGDPEKRRKVFQYDQRNNTENIREERQQYPKNNWQNRSQGDGSAWRTNKVDNSTWGKGNKTWNVPNRFAALPSASNDKDGKRSDSQDKNENNPNSSWGKNNAAWAASNRNSSESKEQPSNNWGKNDKWGAPTRVISECREGNKPWSTLNRNFNEGKNQEAHNKKDSEGQEQPTKYDSFGKGNKTWEIPNRKTSEAVNQEQPVRNDTWGNGNKILNSPNKTISESIQERQMRNDSWGLGNKTYTAPNRNSETAPKEQPQKIEEPEKKPASARSKSAPRTAKVKEPVEGEEKSAQPKPRVKAPRKTGKSIIAGILHSSASFKIDTINEISVLPNSASQRLGSDRKPARKAEPQGNKKIICEFPTEIATIFPFLNEPDKDIVKVEPNKDQLVHEMMKRIGLR